MAAATAAVSLLTPQLLYAAEPRTLSGDDLTTYETTPFDHAAMMGKTIVLGRYHGVAVVAEFPCSDVCPQYTTRVVHLDVAPGSACAAVGGVTESRRVPFSIAMINKDFCIPRPLSRGPLRTY